MASIGELDKFDGKLIPEVPSWFREAPCPAPTKPISTQGSQVPAFDIDTEWVKEIDGKLMETYIDWMTVCCAVTVTGFPAISVPAGFTADKLPVGVQIVGKPKGDFELLRIAHAYELATGHYKTKPPVGS